MKIRLGKFAVQGNRFRNHDYELMRAIQKDMVVLDIEHNIYRDTATYKAEHPAFDEVGLGEKLPTYEVLVDVDGDDNMVVKFKRITE
jgi:hypothetical protein